MTTRQRQNDERELTEPAVDGPAGEDLAAVREAGEGLVAAAEEAIAKALSANSTAFLAAVRQRGGQ